MKERTFAWQEWLDTVKPRAAESTYASGWSSRGLKTLGEVITLAERGWSEGSTYVQTLTLPTVTTVQRGIAHDGWQYDVTGADYDVGEYLSGVPECWLAQNAHETRPVVSIIANICVSSGIGDEAILHRGSAIVALAMLLQTAGYVVRAYACAGIETRSLGWQRVELTDPNGGPLDTNRLMFAYAHPAALRSIGFAVADALTGKGTPAWPSGGAAARDAYPKDKWACDLFIPSGYLSETDWNSAAGVEAWVRETFAKLTGDNNA